MKTVVLHIGLPKTATTLIQNTLCAAPDKMAALGLAYLQSGSDVFGDRGHHILIQNTLGLERGKRIRLRTPDDDILAAWDRARAEIRQSSADQILISSELFSFALIADADVAAVRDALKEFDLRVVLVLRDVADFVDSVYMQRIKGGYGQSVGDFVSQSWVNLNWQALYDRWARAFGAENVRALDFAAMAQGNLVENFLRDAFDVTIDGKMFDPDSTNASLPYYASQMLREVNASDIPNKMRVELKILVRDFFETHGRQGTFKKAKFLDDSAKSILRHYCQWPPIHGT